MSVHTANGTANGRYTVFLRVKDGTGKAFVEDVAKGPKASTVFGRLFTRAKLGEISFPDPKKDRSPDKIQTIRDNTVVVVTDNPNKVHRALFFRPRTRQYKNIGVVAFRIA